MNPVKFQLKNALTPGDIYGGTVSYINFDKDTAEQWNVHLALTLKRKSFEHEKEYRAILRHPFGNSQEEQGIDVSINNLDFINDIYISPSVPSYFKDAVELLLKRYGYSKPMKQSRLNEEPDYIY